MAQRRSARAFLRQVADELPSHLPPKLRSFEGEQWGRYYKVWYREKKIHFEVQFLRNGRLEIGLHFEADAETNERLASALSKKKTAIRSALGDDAKFREFGPGWRSVAETWSGGDMRSEEAATEAASRLGEYVAVLSPMLENVSGSAPSSATSTQG
jgi:hypothetical protein